MIGTVLALGDELRRMHVPVSTGDLVNAAAALEVTALLDRDGVREALACCLAKGRDYRDVFDLLFDLYFGPRAAQARGAAPEPDAAPDALAGLDDERLRDLLLLALRHENRPLMRDIAAEAVSRYAKFEPGRAVAGTYYIFRTMRALGGERLAPELEGQLGDSGLGGGLGVIARAAKTARAQGAVSDFERVVETEVRRRLVADRGADAVAAMLRSPLPVDAEFLTASGVVVEKMGELVEPLARALSRLLADTARAATRSRLDVRGTIRESMSTGGAPVTLRFLPPEPLRPKLVLLADISGSVASFASFALQLAFALKGRFSSLRSFVFVDGVDEVSDLVGDVRSITETTRRINAEGRGVWLDGHSDYGNAFATFVDNHLAVLDPRTTVLVLGDARNNYRDPRLDAVDAIRNAAAALFWLNPERRALWADGDSAMHRYVDHCDRAIECRTIRHLETFIASLD